MFIAECKKLFRPIYLLIALFITIVFYNQEFSFILKYWPNGGMVPVYDQASDWENRFGQTLEDEEITEIRAEYSTLIEKANQIVAENSIAKQLQLTNYDEYQSWVQEYFPGGATKEQNEAEREIVKKSESIQRDLTKDMGQNTVIQMDVMGELIDAIKQFNSSEAFFDHGLYTGQEQQRLSETLFEAEGWRTIMPSFLPSHLALYFERMLVLFILLFSLLVPPVFVKDRLVGLQKNQWSSHHGRKIIWTQFFVGMTASFLLITCIVMIFGGILYTTDFTKYFSSGLTSFFTASEEPYLFSFYQWTLNQWMLNIILLIYIIGLAYSGVLLFLAQTSRHYLSLLMKIIPVAFIFIVIANQMLTDVFYLKNSLYQWTKIPLSEFYAGILLLAICISFPIIYCVRQRNRDLLG